jgi:DNA mismatch repair ATPase MutS
MIERTHVSNHNNVKYMFRFSVLLRRTALPTVWSRSCGRLSDVYEWHSAKRCTFFDSRAGVRSLATLATADGAPPVVIPTSSNAKTSRRKSSVDPPANTPSMSQWVEIKDEHPGFVLLFQLGDFFELFYDDAIKASQTVGLTLTKRRSRLVKGERVDIPMAGIPIASLNVYLEKFIALGVRVAVCEQVESSNEAKKNRRVVKRQVTRLVTPGTLHDDWLSSKRSAYLVALQCSADSSVIALAWTDLSTGEFGVTSCGADAVGNEIARLAPSELLLPAHLTRVESRENAGAASTVTMTTTASSVPASLAAVVQRSTNMLISPVDAGSFSKQTALEQLKQAFGDHADTQVLAADGATQLEFEAVSIFSMLLATHGHQRSTDWSADVIFDVYTTPCT